MTAKRMPPSGGSEARLANLACCDSTANFAERARPLVEAGLPVFPCGRTKAPLTRHGFKDATVDSKTIAAWSSRWPDALVGVPTGSVTGLFVFDIDKRADKDGLETLRQHGWKLPRTRCHHTPSGGRHYLFRDPAGELGCSAGKLGPGLDTRGNGGFIIWWAAHGCVVEDAGILADVPPWIVEGLKPRLPAPAPSTASSPDRYAETRLGVRHRARCARSRGRKE